MPSFITPSDALAQLELRAKVRSSMSAYVDYMDFGDPTKPAQHHLMLMHKLDAVVRGEIPKLMVFWPPGSAKALELDTPIPTTDGWKTMETLSVGDRVFDENGDPCNVTWKSQIFKDRPVYRIVTDDGDCIIADRDHEWLVSMGGGGHTDRNDGTSGRSPSRIYETHELDRKLSKRPMIKRAGILKTPEVLLPINPYLLGLWLGDGNSAEPGITSSVEDQFFIRGRLHDLGIETSSRSSILQYGILNQRSNFVELNLLHSPAHNAFGHKHIPQIYLRASIEQRMELLRGLIDSDGTVDPARGCTTFNNTNIILAMNVRELVRTLGVKAGWQVSDAVLNGKVCGECYGVSFYLEGSAALPRKAKYTRNQTRTPNTYIDVSFSGTADTMCISVDSPSHLFLCGESMLPTHNSRYCSERLPAFYLGNHPKNSVLACSHTQELADRFGRRVRNIFTMPEHQALFGVGVARDSAAASHWSTDQEGEYFAAGVGVAIAGRRADLGLIDDPVKNREDADSLRAQERTYDWYINDFVTRLKPNAAQVFIATRWHERDLAGRILEREAKDWEIFELAMEAQPGDPLGRKLGDRLWPEWFTDRMVDEAKRDARSWQALYQQRPFAEEGDFFKLQWFTEYDSLPDNVYFYGASDYAVTEGHGDFTEHGIIAIDAMENIYIVDWWRGQTTPDMWIEKQCDFIQEYDPLTWFGESGPIRRAVEPYLNKRMTERGAECRIEWLPSVSDKASRCRNFQAKASMGKIFLPKTAAWKGPLLEQLTHFPGGRFDDGVDVCSLFGRGLEKIRAPRLRRYARHSEASSLENSDLSWMIH